MGVLFSIPNTITPSLFILNLSTLPFESFNFTTTALSAEEAEMVKEADCCVVPIETFCII